ncbi:MAG TPA: hypothetical protein VGY58_04675 [Gemmataceae bacterium]|nr:hypothetical protein [Gemmataceae bacterium]
MYHLFRGKYIDHGKPVEFDKPGFEHKKLDADAGLRSSLAALTDDKRSRDGIAPLSTDVEAAAQVQFQT